jgi:hypothetical protein
VCDKFVAVAKIQQSRHPRDKKVAVAFWQRDKSAT